MYWKLHRPYSRLIAVHKKEVWTDVIPHGMNYDKRKVTLCRISSDMIVFIFVDNRKLLNAQLPGKSVVSMQKLVHSYNQIKKETTIDSFSSCAWHLCYVTCPQWSSCWKVVMTMTWPYLATLLWRWKMSHVRTQTFQLLLTARKFSWFFFSQWLRMLPFLVST